MRDAEAHLGAKGSGEQFARDLGRVDRRRRLQAIVAIAAALWRVFAEVPKQDRPAARRRFDQRGKRVEPLALAGAAVRLDLEFDSPTRDRKVLGRPEQSRVGGLAVTPGAAGFLVERLDRLGIPAWATTRTSGLSMPIPNATVATITISSELTNAAWLRARTRGSSPA
jgi:hypothetical protein